MFHVFVYVVRSIQDPFAGIRAMLQIEGAGYADIRFEEGEFDLIDAVEYTSKRPLRAWYYRRIFRKLESRLDAVLAEHPARICVYFSDEGVWAVLWAHFRARLARRNIVAVNVQHGQAPLHPANLRNLRRLINAAAIALTNYPVIGYGSAGGAGPEPFEFYLTYNQATAAFAERQSGRTAIVAPHLIKHELISRFGSLPKVDNDEPVRVLFAMNINIAGSPVLCSACETFDILLDVARALRDAGVELVIRLHPAMDREVESRRFTTHPIARIAALDQEPSLHASMARARIVMSYVSTALWEGGLLGLVPVQLVCSCCKRVELGYSREVLDLGADIHQQLSRLLTLARRPRERDWRGAEAEEWACVKKLLSLED